MLEVILVGDHVLTNRVVASRRGDPLQAVAHDLCQRIALCQHDAAVVVPKRVELWRCRSGIDEAERVHAVVLEKRFAVHRRATNRGLLNHPKRAPSERGVNVGARRAAHDTRIGVEQHHQRRVGHADSALECIELGEKAPGPIRAHDWINPDTGDPRVSGQRGRQWPIGDKHEIPVRVLEHGSRGTLSSPVITPGSDRGDTRRDSRQSRCAINHSSYRSR